MSALTVKRKLHCAKKPLKPLVGHGNSPATVFTKPFMWSETQYIKLDCAMNSFALLLIHGDLL